MADIFLSYNEKDRDTVRRIAETLTSVGWSVWWDRRIPAGGTWRHLLEQELQAMRCMIVVWSAHSVESEWVCEEATEGRSKGCLVPVRIEDVKPPAGFREIQAADLIEWDGTTSFVGMRTLIVNLQQRIGEPSVSPGMGRMQIEEARRTRLDPVIAATTRSTRRPSNRMIAGVLLALLVVGGLYAANDMNRATDAKQRDAMLDAANRATSAVDAAKPAEASSDISSDPAPNTRPKRPANLPPPLGEPAVATSANAVEVKLATKPSKATLPTRCADLSQRFSVGETPSAEEKSFMQKKCGS